MSYLPDKQELFDGRERLFWGIEERSESWRNLFSETFAERGLAHRGSHMDPERREPFRHSRRGKGDRPVANERALCSTFGVLLSLWLDRGKSYYKGHNSNAVGKFDCRSHS